MYITQERVFGLADRSDGIRVTRMLPSRGQGAQDASIFCPLTFFFSFSPFPTFFFFLLCRTAVCSSPFSLYPCGKMHNGMRGPDLENRGNVRGIVEFGRVSFSSRDYEQRGVSRVVSQRRGEFRGTSNLRGNRTPCECNSDVEENHLLFECANANKRVNILPLTHRARRSPAVFTKKNGKKGIEVQQP